jgi:hypothetical protein
MEKGPPWVATKSLSYSRNSPTFLEPEGSLYRLHKNPALVPILSQMNPVFTIFCLGRSKGPVIFQGPV